MHYNIDTGLLCCQLFEWSVCLLADDTFFNARNQHVHWLWSIRCWTPVSTVADGLVWSLVELALSGAKQRFVMICVHMSTYCSRMQYISLVPVYPSLIPSLTRSTKGLDQWVGIAGPWEQHRGAPPCKLQMKSTRIFKTSISMLTCQPVTQHCFIIFFIICPAVHLSAVLRPN